MAMLKYGNASLIQSNISVDGWVNNLYNVACSNGKCRMKTAKTVLAKYDPSKYYLSHCTIIAAVDTDLANPKDEKSDYLIKPEYSQFVNNNGDAWSKKLLQKCYRTFIGANNYLEHIQVPELSKGKVIDAVLRDIPIGKDKEGNDLTTYYVDILVATDRKHDDLIRKIEANDLNTLSMGCTISYSICSRCGNKAVDETEACQHVRFEKNNLFYDDNGIQRKVAELCGHWSESESVKFVDASWVKTPAFVGAVKRSTITVPDDIENKLKAAEKVEGYRKKEGDFLKAAHVIAQDEETPVEEDPAEEAPPEESPADEAPLEEAPEQGPEFNLESWKEETKKELMDQIRDEILKELNNEKRPNELETLDDTIIKPASVLKKMWGAKLSWDRFIKQSAGNLDKGSFDKLRHGSHIALTSTDPTILKDYGYSKRDFLAVLSFIDSNTTNPLTFKIKRAVASMGGTENKAPLQVLAKIVKITGEKITKAHAKKALVWVKMLDNFDR